MSRYCQTTRSFLFLLLCPFFLFFFRVFFLEWNTENLKECGGFVFILRACYDNDRHAKNIFKVFIDGLGKNRLLFESESEVPHNINAFPVISAEVACSWCRNVDEFIKKSVHPIFSERYHNANFFTFTKLKRCDGFFRSSHCWLLPGDLCNAVSDKLIPTLLL